MSYLNLLFKRNLFAFNSHYVHMPAQIEIETAVDLIINTLSPNDKPEHGTFIF